MAITTLDGVISGMRPPECFIKTGGTMEAAGVRHSLFYTAGMPGAAAAPTPGLEGAALTSYPGQIPFTNPTGGKNSYLARFCGVANVSGCLYLCDRLWHNSGIVVATTTEQEINSVEFPPRDRDGTINGANVLVAIEVRIATTNAAAVTTITMSYTNSEGVIGRTATIPTFPATAVAGTIVPFMLEAGDVGIKSIQSITLGTSLAPSGTPAIHLVAYRILGRGYVPLIYVGFDQNAVATGFVRLYDNTVPFLVWLASATTAITPNGFIVVTQG